MIATPLAKLVPRSVWDIADDALDLYRARFVPLCGLAAMFMGIPFVVFLALIKTPVGQLMQSVESGAKSNSADVLAAFWNLVAAFLIAAPLYWIARSLLDGAIAVVVGEYITAGELVSIGGALKRTFQKTLPLLGSSLVISAAIMVGSLVTGILAWLPITLWAFAGATIMLEGKGPISALRRSNSLVSGSFGKTLGLIILMQTFPGFLGMAFGGVLITAFSLIPLSGDPVNEGSTRLMISVLLFLFAGLVTMPLEAIARMLLYFDVRVRREGLDVVAQAIEQDYALMDDPFGDISSEEARQRQVKAARRR